MQPIINGLQPHNNIPSLSELPRTTGQISGAGNSHLSGPSSIDKKGFYYVPFASKDILMFCAMDNHIRVKKNKEPYPVICKNDKIKTKLEELKKNDVDKFKADLTLFINQAKKMGFKISSDENGQLTPESLEKLMPNLSSTEERLYYKGLMESIWSMDIRSNETGLWLSQLKPEQHKIYIQGHGVPGSNSIFSSIDFVSSEKLMAGELAQQLKSGGLDPNFYDFRVINCYSADTRIPSSFNPKDLERAAQPKYRIDNFFGLISLLSRGPGAKDEIIGQPFSQDLSNQLKMVGFNNPNVLGYHGIGVSGPKSTGIKGYNIRMLGENLQDRTSDVRRSEVGQRFTPDYRQLFSEV